MKKLLILFLIVAACKNQDTDVRNSLSLAGEWKFSIDSLDKGIENKWYENLSDESVTLPGSMAENGKGDEVSLNTPWTGDIVDQSYFTDKKYEKYRQPGNIKIPFWLKPVKYYKGAAWYQKEFEIPDGWEGKNIILFLERPHWESTVWVNGKEAGTENSLSVPQTFNITGFLKSGRNLISIRTDNRIVIPVGVNSHSVSDHTQSNWNGIVGDISLRATSPVYIRDVSIFPDVKAGKAKVIVALANTGNTNFRGRITLQAESFNTPAHVKVRVRNIDVDCSGSRTELVADYPMGKNVQLWSEFSPYLYKLTVNLENEKGKVIDSESEDFGMREFKTSGTRFVVNGRQVFLRGTLECCIFPLTGYPPTDLASWEKVLTIIKKYGLNTVRFHSWCPPEAAFIAADKLGLYFQIECSSWANQGTSIGDGSTIDRYIYTEGDRIMQEYGNHPSFCMLAYGNEPAGNNQAEYLGKLLDYWKSKDNRRVYTSAAGWPFIPENDYNLSPEPRIQHWGEGLKSIINSKAPETMYDFGEYISKFKVPVVGHEIGQWCVYPDFSEITKYTGVLKATNFEIFRETLDENNMGNQSGDFVKASGRLQSLCYKADIEAALRTQGFAGFHLLQLHDFPGQGSALVGILNPFFESKGYITPEEFRNFCCETVPLARMEKQVFRNNEKFTATLEMAHFGSAPLTDNEILCLMVNQAGDTLATQSFKKEKIEIGNCIPLGTFVFDLSNVVAPEKLTLKVSLKNTVYRNSWDIWVYPEVQKVNIGNVLVTQKLDANAERVLSIGGSVLLLVNGLVGKEKGAQVATGFSTIFWNTAWTNNQAPHTMGILCDPLHPVFRNFPTEYHSNWQWWDPVSHSQAMILDGFPSGVKPMIQMIDTWFENRRLALAFESRTGGGKLLVCSIDLKELPDNRVVSKQLLLSMLNYMNSSEFNPSTLVDKKQILSLLN
jgi:hypothetical protein